MTKKMFWFACLGLLCCGLLAFAINANSPAKLSAAEAAALTGKAAVPMPGKPVEAPAVMEVQTPVVGSVDAVELETLTKTPEETALEDEIARLESMLNSTSTIETEVPMDVKEQLNALYARRAINRTGSPLDQGNDACPATVIASLPYSDTGTTTGMVNDYTTCGPNTAEDVIYQFVAPQTTTIRVSLCGSSYDTRLEIRSGGACPGDTQVGCNDDFCGLQSQIDVAATAGTTYYVIVDGFSSSDGAYTLNITPLQPCVITCQGGDITEVAENPADTTFYRTDPDGGCNTTPPSFGNVACGQTVCGLGFTYLGPGGANYRDTDWYLFTIAQPETIRVNVRAEFPVLAGIVNNVNPCNVPAFVVSGVQTNACSLLTIQAICLAPGTYAMFVAPSVFTGVDTPRRYRATLECSAPCPPCAPDFTINAPGSWATTTCGAADNCNLRAGEDRIVRVNIPTAGNWTFSLCDPVVNWDSYMYITDQCCGGNIIASDDDSCPEFGVGHPRIVCLTLAAGTYYVDIEPFSNGVCGDVTLNVTQCEPCDVICGPNDIAEVAEQPADTSFYRTDPDGGCNSVPPSFQNIQCGQTVCGRNFTYTPPQGGQFRDTDWFLFTITEPETIRVTVRAEYAVLAGIVRNVNPCNAPAFVASGTTTLACDSVTVTALCLAPGDYAMFVAPNTFAGLATPLDYRARLECSAPCPPCQADGVINDGNGSFTANMCGAGDNCNLRAGEDLIVQVNITTAGEYTFTTCNSAISWDSYMFLTDDCCGGNIINQNDDGCGGVGHSTIICQHLEPGSYYVDLEPFSAGTCDEITLDVAPCEPCIIDCQPGDVIECAEVQDSTNASTDCNGGCNNDPSPHLYQTISTGETVCGRAFHYVGPGGGQFRDTDWFQFELTCSTAVEWEVSAAFGVLTFVLDATDCNNILLLAQGGSEIPCDTSVAVTDILPPGTYVAWVGPSAFAGIDTPLPYRATLRALTPCVCDPVADLTAYLNIPRTNMWLHWTGEAGEQYEIYSTTDRSYPDTPFPGPQWTLEATVNAVANGQQEWTDPAAVGQYKRYLVVHVCN